MSIRVRRHQRELASGKTTTVRQHERSGSPREAPPPQAGSWWDGSREELPDGAGEHPDGSSFFRQDDDVFAVHPDGSVHPVTAAEAEEVRPVDPAELRCPEDRGAWGGAPAWDDRHQQPGAALKRMQDEMRHWRSAPEPTPRPDKPMNPQLARVLGCDTPEGRARYDRGRAYREAGYRGPLNSDNRIPDPDDPAEYESLSALAALSEI